MIEKRCHTPNKRVWDSQSEAKRQAKKIKRLTGKRLYVYRCWSCGLFHHTSHPNPAGVRDSILRAARYNQARRQISERSKS